MSMKHRVRKSSFEEKFCSKEEIELFFAEINKEKISSWKNFLLNYKLKERKISDIKEEDIFNVSIDQNLHKIIINDVQRSRVKERYIFPEFREVCIKFLVFYTTYEKIEYKQGLHEILSPFILLKYKVNTLSYTTIYILFTLFIDKFLTNYYHETDFYSLQSSLSLVNVLIKYHDPELYNLLDKYCITPEMYGTNLILTIFANKCSLDVLYHLWDKLIILNDNLLVNFLVAAYIISNKILFFNTDFGQIPIVLSQLNINTKSDAEYLIEKALDLINITPHSFWILSEKLEIFKYRSKNTKSLYENYCPNKMLAMPLFPSEILTINYKDDFYCSNEHCANFDIRKNKKIIKNKDCIYCSKFNENKHLSYILIDLRLVDRWESNYYNEISNNSAENKDIETYNNEYNKLAKDEKEKYCSGFLPLSVAITEEELFNENFPNNIIDKFRDDKNNMHFIFLTSYTNYFEEFQEKFYSNDNETCENYSKDKYGIMTKANQNLDYKFNELKNNNDHIEIDKLEIKLLEFDKLKKIVSAFQKEGFKYMSFAYGGYTDTHTLLIKKNIDILGHGDKCFLCRKGDYKKYFKWIFMKK